MAAFKGEPCPVLLARQRRRAATAFASVAFVAIGAMAWIGLEAVRMPEIPNLAHTATSENGDAHQEMVTLDTPLEDEPERLAMLDDEDSPMEIKPLGSVVELTPFDPIAFPEPNPTVIEPQLTEVTSVIAASPSAQPLLAANSEVTLETANLDAGNCIDDLLTITQAHQIRFAIGSADLSSADLASLSELGYLATSCPEAIVQVTGHSDSSGSDFVNLALSWQRADNTIAALAALGINTSQFEPVGFGARTPFAQGDSSDEELNRRVEFVVLQSIGE